MQFIVNMAWLKLKFDSGKQLWNGEYAENGTPARPGGRSVFCTPIALRAPLREVAGSFN